MSLFSIGRTRVIGGSSAQHGTLVRRYPKLGAHRRRDAQSRTRLHHKDAFGWSRYLNIGSMTETTTTLTRADRHRGRFRGRRLGNCDVSRKPCPRPEVARRSAGQGSPRRHRHRYFGVLAPHALARSEFRLVSAEQQSPKRSNLGLPRRLLLTACGGWMTLPQNRR